MSTCSSSFLLNRGGRPRRRKNTRRFSALLAVPEMPQSYKSVYVMERDWVVFCWQAVLLARAVSRPLTKPSTLMITRLKKMFTVPMASVGTAMATYVGQNHGAHRTDRVRQGIRDGCILQLCYCAAAWVVLFFVKGWAVGLVLGDADPAVTSGAVEYLTVISVLFCINGLLMVFRNTLQGLGYSVQAVISGVGELIGRALCGWLAVHSLGYFGICIANPIAWGLALLYCVFMVTRVLKKENA